MMPHNNLLQNLEFEARNITSCDFRGNDVLAISSSDKKIWVMEWKPGLGFVDKQYSPIKSHLYGIVEVRFSPKGVLLVSLSIDGTANLYNVETGIKFYTMNQPNNASIRCCGFSYDSTKLITAGDDGAFCFWDLVNRSSIRQCQLHDEDFGVKGLAISTDSLYLLTVDSNGGLKLWNVENIITDEPNCILFLKNLHDGIQACDFSPIKYISGNHKLCSEYFWATGGCDNFITIWKVCINHEEKNDSSCEFQTLFTVRGHESGVLNLKFSSCGHILLSTGLDNYVKLWHVSKGTCYRTFKGPSKFGTCSAFSKDLSLLATSSNKNSVVIWDLNNNLTLDSHLSKTCNISDHFTDMELINYYNQYSINENESSGKYRCKEYSVLQEMSFSKPINSVHFYSNNLLAVAEGNKVMTILNKGTDKFTFEVTEIIQNHRSYQINHLEVSPCGTKVISCSKDEIILFWNLNTGLTFKMVNPNCKSGLRICKFSPNSKFIVAGGDDEVVFLWDACNLEFLKSIQPHEESITAMGFTPDSKFLVSACYRGNISVFGFEDNKSCLCVNDAHDLGVLCCDFSLATVFSDGSNEIYSSDLGSEYNQNYLLVTCGNDSLIKLWHLSDSKIEFLKTLSGHLGAVHCVKFCLSHPLILASCGADCTVRIWQVKSGNCLQILHRHNNSVTTCSFAQDSTMLATGSLDKSILIWSLKEYYRPDLSEITEFYVKPVERWKTSDIARWFEDIGCSEISKKVLESALNGEKLFTFEDETILGMIKLDNETEKTEVKHQLKWLRKEATWNYYTFQCGNKTIPHKFLCPITHELMSNPVVCSDGYTYERKAITEWFLSGQYVSPVTKQLLTNTELSPNHLLKKLIYEYLYDDAKKNFFDI